MPSDQHEHDTPETPAPRLNLTPRLLLVTSLLLLVGAMTFAVMRPQTMKMVVLDRPDTAVGLTPRIEGLDAPVDLATPDDDSGRLFIVEREGRVVLAQTDGTVLDRPILDLTDQVQMEGEGGMLSIAFHPDFRSQQESSGEGRFYLTWTSPEHSVMLGEFTLPVGSNVAREAWRVILDVPQPTFDHNGGALAFGPDGYLYVSIGDGSHAGKQWLEAQDLGSLLGKILRIDVDRSTGDHPYAIPADNPFVGDDGSRAEIYALGLRNPWRISFDGDVLWAADVGAAASEEIDLIHPGHNYGWPLYEGDRFKAAAFVRHIAEGRAAEYFSDLITLNVSADLARTPPIAVRPHGEAAAIIGGLVVDDRAGLPDLAGRYLFADFVAGTISSLAYDGETATITPLLDDAGPIVSFARDMDGAVLAVSLAGTVYQLEAG